MTRKKHSRREHDGIEKMNLLWDRPGFLIRRLRQIHVAIFLNSCRGFRITPLQYSLMSILKVSKRLDQSSLAEAIGIDRINAADVMKRLQKAGLIKRESDRADQRVRLVSLTRKGTRTLKKIEPRARYAHDAILKILTSAERKLLISFLQRMIIDKNGLGRAPLKIVWQ